MKIRAPLGLLLTVCASLPLAACGRVEGQFVVLQNQAPQTGCTIPSDVSAFYRPDGVLDVSIVAGNDQATAGYLVFPLLENDLPGVAMGQTVDGNRIALAGWQVDVLMGPEASLDSFMVPTSGSVASGGGHTASVVDVIRPTVARGMLSVLQGGKTISVDAKIHAIGNTINGEIDSDDFHFPITLCNGCLVASSPMCPVRIAPSNVGNPCNPAQDELVDCCLLSSKLVCPALVAQ